MGIATINPATGAARGACESEASWRASAWGFEFPWAWGPPIDMKMD
jgi:hypothetical protein